MQMWVDNRVEGAAIRASLGQRGGKPVIKLPLRSARNEIKKYSN
jgi:hypothetical protein